jgi:hypothetical protein
MIGKSSIYMDFRLRVSAGRRGVHFPYARQSPDELVWTSRRGWLFTLEPTLL